MNKYKQIAYLNILCTKKKNMFTKRFFVEPND